MAEEPAAADNANDRNVIERHLDNISESWVGKALVAVSDFLIDGTHILLSLINNGFGEINSSRDVLAGLTTMALIHCGGSDVHPSLFLGIFNPIFLLSSYGTSSHHYHTADRRLRGGGGTTW